MSQYGASGRCEQYGGAYGYHYQQNSGSYYDPTFSNQPSWGYIILYLTVICVSLLGNFIFCMIIKKCPNLHRTHHFFFLAIAVMDIFICLLVIPFIIDSQAKNRNWDIAPFLCKFYKFVDYGLKGVHAYLLLLGCFFLFFWYRKNELYSTETGEVRSRSMKMHRWAIPLAWVLGLGIGGVAGAMATMDKCGRCEVWHAIGPDMRPNMASGNDANVLLAYLIGGFLVPLVLVILPLIALILQIFGARSPRLDPPHSRTAILMIIFVVLFIASRSPHDIYELMNMYGNKSGNRANTPMGQSIESQMALDCMVYIPMLLHPILFILLQPEYRQGLRDILRSCGSGSSSRSDRENPYGQGTQKKFAPRPAPIVRGGGRRFGHNSNNGQLVGEQQPMIVPAGGGVVQPQRPYPKPVQGYTAQGTAYIQPQGAYIPLQPIQPVHKLPSPQSYPLLDNSFDEHHEPELPARFTSGKFQYIDTARVQPKIAYTPTNTPPKTPQIPHFDVKPFKQPNYIDGVWNYPGEQEPYTGPMPAHMIPVEGFADPNLASSRAPVGVDQSSPPRMEEPMEIECLDSSPGTTIRSSRRGRPLEGPPGVNRLQASPGARRRGDGGRLEDAPAKQAVTNGHGRNGPESPPDLGTQSVEITLSGRSRSRQDLCPEVRPKSRFEHAV